MKENKQKCGYVEVNYPVDTAGNNKIWVCHCKTTACFNMTTKYVHMTPVIAFGRYIHQMKENGTELTPEEEDKFYKKVMKTELI